MEACLNTLLLPRPFQYILPNKLTELQEVRVGKVLTVSIPYIANEFQHANNSHLSSSVEKQSEAKSGLNVKEIA